MHLNCLQENLAQGLGIVQRAVATRTTLPITQHVLLATDEGRLKFSATNLEVAISTWVGAEVLEDGPITIPARLLTDFINSLERQHVEIKTTSPAKGIELKGEHVQSTMNGADASEFPPIPSVDEGISTKVAPKALRTAIHQVVMAAAVEDSRPVLTGVNVELEGTKLVLAAADGFRLAVHTTELLEPVSERLSLIVHVAAPWTWSPNCEYSGRYAKNCGVGDSRLASPEFMTSDASILRTSTDRHRPGPPRCVCQVVLRPTSTTEAPPMDSTLWS